MRSFNPRSNPTQLIVVVTFIVLCATGVYFFAFRGEEVGNNGLNSSNCPPPVVQYVKEGKEAPRCAEDGTENNGGCSGNGHCFIGKCFCENGYTGDYCEFAGQVKKVSCPTDIESLRVQALDNKDPNAITKYDYCVHYNKQFGTGVISKKRWGVAQEFEAAVWNGGNFADDRDNQHAQWFGNYDAVPSFLGNMIELGSGPFTQSRTIIGRKKSQGKADVTSITLVEPLMAHYIKNTVQCSYKDGSLLGYPTILMKAGGEQARFRDQYDTVVMMNVLEHVLNAFQVLQNLHNLVKPGGTLVFSERWYDKKWDKYENTGAANPFWDKGHPVNLKRSVYEHMLKHYQPLYRRDFDYEGDYPTDEGVYFIGKKKQQ